MENQISQFDELAVRHNAAMAAYLSMYESRAPRPQKEQINRDMVSLITMIALAIVMVAAVIVSSSRTIEEFGGGAIGTTAFIMVEGGIMAYAFFRARRNASKTRLQNTVKWATFGLILTFIVGLGANTDASLRHQGIELPSWFNTAIHLLVAISAPSLAFISSDVLAIELMATDIKRRDADDRHKISMDEWWTGFNRSWISQQKNWGVKVEIESQHQLSRDNSSNLIKNNDISRFKPSPKLQKALDYLRQNEGDLFTAPRELESKFTGISYGTIHKAQMIIRAEKEGG